MKEEFAAYADGLASPKMLEQLTKEELLVLDTLCRMLRNKHPEHNIPHMARLAEALG